jgi:Fic-DOC domain mobile mystery protein B
MGGKMIFNYAPGATPLDPDEANGLIPKHITTQGQLNEWEQMNILDAEKWLRSQRFNIIQISTNAFIKKLHQRMFDQTWRWAGQFRKSNKNIGVDWLHIPVNLKILMDDLCYQLENNIYPLDELAVRFHHRLVVIHPFANGNGRHARLMADILLLSQNKTRFSWGNAGNFSEPSTIRKEYIHALRTADKGNYTLLIDFVRQ